MIDLHTHTTASDGRSTPDELVERAAAAGVTVLAVTDHDTVAAIPACVEAAARIGGIEIVPGIEISASWKGREIHVLGHFLDPTDERLLRALERFREQRRERMEKMVARCRALGLSIDLDDLGGDGRGEGSWGRPHLARALVRGGHAGDMQEAFDRWIGAGGPAFVERVLPDAAEAIDRIRSAGGCASVAHPALSKLGGNDLGELAGLGLAGVEVDHPRQPPHVRRTLRRQAARLGLQPTAGSDDHGPDDGPAQVGREAMDEGCFAAYRSRAASTVRK